jgi:hypothetical protein
MRKRSEQVGTIHGFRQAVAGLRALRACRRAFTSANAFADTRSIAGLTAIDRSGVGVHTNT